MSDVTAECEAGVDREGRLMIVRHGAAGKTALRTRDGYSLIKKYLYREGAQADAAFIVEHQDS